jgi:hypothetical protein
MSAEKLNLHQKILKIANMAGVLQKTKDGFGYKYVPEEDIQAKVTAGLQKYGVMLYDSIVPGTTKVTPISYEKYDTKIKGLKPVNEVIVSADVVYTWVDVDDPSQRVETTWSIVGQMEDAAQAMGAGLTYGNRYYLMKQLQLATSESDPDNYRSKQRKAENYEQEALEKAAAEELSKHIKEVVDAGSQLIKSGMDKQEMMSIVAKYNDGNGNPSSIKTAEACDLIIKEFNNIQAKKKG